MVTNKPCIQTRMLKKTFGPVEAVRDLDLTVMEGSRFGFLGPNGAGKTTTVRVLCGLLKKTSGHGTVCGFDIDSQPEEIKAATGLLPETPGVYSKLSAVEFLEFVGALNGHNGDALHRRINRLLALLGLEGRQDDLLESYSSGMKQKVLVASTLLDEPRLVFLDEPTARLDPGAAALVKDLILTLAEETAKTFFICTHQTAFAETVCDQIGIIVSGRLLTVGTPQQLIEAANVQHLEDAYLQIVGGKVDRKELLAWR